MSDRNGRVNNILQPNRQPRVQVQDASGRTGHSTLPLQNPATGDITVSHFGGRSNFESTAAVVLAGISLQMDDDSAADKAVSRTKALYEAMTRFQETQTSEMRKEERNSADQEVKVAPSVEASEPPDSPDSEE